MIPKAPTPTAMTIAGSDSGGGAGIQADLKTFSARGVYGTSAITAVTAQNTRAVTKVESLSPEMVAAQIDAVLDDITVHAVKIGMLGTSEIIAAVADRLSRFGGPVVLDPVMVAKSGDTLLSDEAIESLIRMLLPRADIVTPNLPEAARLCGGKVAETRDAFIAQGRALIAMGARAALIKGGHAQQGVLCTDILVTPDSVQTLESPRIATRNTHGTGCSLSAGIAAEMAKGATLAIAVRNAQYWLQGAIRAADGLRIGAGNGPVHHFHGIWP